MTKGLDDDYKSATKLVYRRILYIETSKKKKRRREKEKKSSKMVNKSSNGPCCSMPS